MVAGVGTAPLTVVTAVSFTVAYASVAWLLKSDGRRGAPPLLNRLVDKAADLAIFLFNQAIE